MMVMLILLVFGVAIGAGARHVYGDSMRLVERDAARTEQIELEGEIKRLRAQVALHIGREGA